MAIITLYMIKGDAENPLLPYLWVGLMLPMIVAVFIAGLILTIKRLHDLNLSGWWISVVPALNMSLDFIRNRIYENGYLFLTIFMTTIILVIGLAWSCMLLFKKGTVGANNFGEDPLAPKEIEN